MYKLLYRSGARKVRHREVFVPVATRQLQGKGALLETIDDGIRDYVPDTAGIEKKGRASETLASLHAQLADIIREKIYAREWGVNSKIPSEHELMARYHLARGTVRRAITSLVDEGLLVRKHGKGTFVAEPGIAHASASRPISFAESLEREGRKFATNVVDEWVTPAPADVAYELEIPPFTDVMFIRRVRTVEGEPIMCQESWLNLSVCPGLEDGDYTTESLFHAVQRCSAHKIKYAKMRYSARIVGREHGELLKCDETAAVLMLEQTASLENHTPVEWSTTWFRPGQAVVGTAVQPD